MEDKYQYVSCLINELYILICLYLIESLMINYCKFLLFVMVIHFSIDKDKKIVPIESQILFNQQIPVQHRLEKLVHIICHASLVYSLSLVSSFCSKLHLNSAVISNFETVQVHIICESIRLKRGLIRLRLSNNKWTSC